MNELSLFTGAGGGLLGSRMLGWRTVGYVEWDDYCQRVLAARINDGLLDPAPIFGDVRTFVCDGYAASYQGMVDVVTAGFPCQPFSVAGKRAGEADERNMWPATLDFIRIVRPALSCLKMCGESFALTCQWSSETCEDKAMKSKTPGFLERTMWGLATTVKGYGYLPTPSASDYHGFRCGNQHARRGMMRLRLNHFLFLSGRTDLAHSPTFREWMMGWPIGWTDLKPSATAKCRYAWQRHLG